MSAGPPAVLVALLLVVPAAVMAGGAGAAPGDASALAGGSPQALASPANTTLWISLQETGDARWTVTANFSLDSANETAAFRELANNFEAGNTASLGLPAFRDASERAAAATGRSMAIQAVERRVAMPTNETGGSGRLILAFTWTNFASADNETLEVGDVFAAGDWFPGLEPHQQLVIEAPATYGIVNSEVAPENGTLRWTGPASFPPGELAATFTGETSGPGPTTTPGPDEPAALPWLWMGVGIVLVGGVIATAYVLTRRQPADGGSGVETQAEADPEASEAAPAEEPPDIDEELLSDEERIERLLEHNGGRMKQASIVEETGWSNAKVSQLLSAMDEADRIDKLRIGRENLISFPDEDVTDIEE